MSSLLRPRADDAPPHQAIAMDPERPLIVGVLPHTFCNPSVRGCGFCTFPHEKYSNDGARAVVDRVAAEITALVQAAPSLARRRVDALYFGGGTANLTPPASLRALAAALAAAFDLTRAEVSLEGAPIYFSTRREAMLDVLDEMNVRHRRISMGVQSFDTAWLSRMGRLALGGPEDVESVVRAAHARRMTVSCDLLYNLPGQTLESCLADVRRACEMGFDQICAYNLVLEAGMGTEWSQMPSLLAGVPDRETGCARWLAVRQLLLEAGYVQTTLTNFERREVVESDRRFVYEACSFQPAVYDALGIGPGAISTFTSRTGTSALKWMNEPTSRGYVDRQERGDSPATREFRYGRRDLQILHVTRQLAMLSVDRATYKRFFRTDIVADFAGPLAHLGDARLLRISDTGVHLTPDGMFYADTVAGLIAWERALVLRDDNDPIRHGMG